MPREKLLKFFAELNFHRDALNSFGVPIAIWLSSEELSLMATHATDFWSRRGAVYYFGKPTNTEIVRRLFSKAINEPASPSDKEIETILSRIIGSERNLHECVRKDKEFSLDKADGFINNIREGIESLRFECLSGRQIDVALSLWNLTHVDFALEHWVRSLNVREKNLYEYLYTDRNEILLSLSESISQLIDEYVSNLEASIRGKKQLNLLKIFAKKVTSLLSRMTTQLESQVILSIEDVDLDSETWIDFDRESALQSRIAEALERWLAGHGEPRPKVFNQSEETILKLLYAERLNIKDLANRLGMGEGEARKEVRRLESKVRSYIGIL